MKARYIQPAIVVRNVSVTCYICKQSEERMTIHYDGTTTNGAQGIFGGDYQLGKENNFEGDDSESIW